MNLILAEQQHLQFLSNLRKVNSFFVQCNNVDMANASRKICFVMSKKNAIILWIRKTIVKIFMTTKSYLHGKKVVAVLKLRVINCVI